MLARRTGFRSLYVATDDGEVAERIGEMAGNLDLRVTLLPINRTKYGEGNANGERRHADLIETRPQADFDHAVSAREVYADIVGLARCDALVGPFHSTMDLLVFELITARLGRAPPFVSMDDPWCSDDPANANNFCPDYVPPMARRKRTAEQQKQVGRVARLRELKEALDEGLISLAEYEAAKATLLAAMVA